MSKIVLPGDPDWNDKNDPRMGGKSDDPIIMGDAYAKGLTPKTAVEKHIQEIEELRGKDDATFKYASSQITNMPDAWIKNAQATGVSNIMANPMWFSPLHTPQNWQVASKRREIYQWCRFFYENEPKVAAAIDFYSRFPMNGFDLVCEDHKILNWFDHHVVKRLNLNEQLKMISSEYFMLGDVFIHTDIECPECKSSGINPDTGEQCNHPGGNIRRLIILNPDWIEVQQNVLADEPAIIMIPDDELKRIVFYQQPKNIYDRIPDHVKKLVIANKPIPLSSRVMSHIKHMPVPYGTYGSSLIRRLFTTLAYKTKIMTANWIVAERLILPVRVVKIGSDNRPASSADIADIQQQLAATANDPNLTIVTHHNFDYDWYGCLTTEDNNSRVMTSRGLVHYSKLTEKDLIATWNAETGKIEYQKYIRNIEFAYNKKNSTGVAYKVGNRDWMGSFTPNHRHYLTNGEIKRSDELSVGDEIVKASQWKWQGGIPVSLDYKNWHGFDNLSLEEFCRFAGYFVTEGHVKHEKTKNLSSKYEAQAFAISQNVDADFYNDIKNIMFKLSSRCYITTDERRVVPNHQFNIANATLSRILKSNFGSGSTNKHLPSWMLGLPCQYLEILLKAMIDGDGDSKRNRFSTVSVELKDQFMEILTKLGFSPYCSIDNIEIENRNNIFRILWSSNDNPRKFKISKIETIEYEGNMWCLEMPNKNFFVEIDGHILLTGNTSGKVLQITQELEHIDKEILDGFMLNQSLLNGEMCIPEDDKMLTRSGFKNLAQISEDDEIATYNKETGKLEYQKPTAIHQYDWNGDLIHFQTDRIDFACTPNHRMLYQKRDHDEWIVDTADKVKNRAKFIKTVDWDSENDILDQLECASHCMPWDMNFDEMMKIVAYYVTEGHCSKETRKERRTYNEINGLHIAQTKKGKGWNDLCELQSECTTFDIKETRHGFAIYNKEFAKFMSEICGRTSYEKRIPKWIKNHTSDKLRVFLGYLINGDGALRTRDKNGPKKYYTYYTKSDQLKDDVTEIALKCGYFPRFRKRRGTWEVTFSDYDLGQKTITLESKKHKTVSKIPYKGRVWCVTVPNSFIVTERNGKLMVSGNSGYQSAQVGVETLIRRIESWRHTLAHWVEENVFKPIAEMQGFIDEAKSEEFGEKVYLYPTIKWNDLNLKDKTQWHQLLMQLHDKQVISTQTLCEELDLDYDQEVQRMRYEQASGSPMLGGMGAGGAGGDDMGMGLGGGGMGGGMGDMGADPAAAGAMGGAGGDMMGGDMGGGMDAGMGGPMASGMKVMKKGKGSEKNQDMPEGPAPMIKLTSIEQSVRSMLDEIMSGLGWNPMKIAQNVRMQFPVDNPKGHKRYRLDFAFPNFKLGIECDGDYFHNRPEQVKNDKERDFLLAQRGWTILRFNDKTINEIPQKVKSTILSYIKKALSGTKEAQKNPVIFFTVQNGELKDISGEYDRYLKQVHKISYSEIHHKNGQNTIKNQSEMFE